MHHRLGAALLGACVLFIVGAGVAVGCGWMGTSHSVRFNAWIEEKDFSRLPPLPFSAREKTRDVDEYIDEEQWEEKYERKKRVGKELDALWQRALEASEGDDLGAARKLLGEYLGRAGGDACGETDQWAERGCVPARRTFAADQLDALTALEHGASPQAVRAYLSARHAYDLWLRVKESVGKEQKEPGVEEGKTATADEVRAALELIPRHASLEDNVEYLRAAVLYREDGYAEATEAFNQLAARYPRSEKREAALYMSGLSSLKQSKSYTGGHAAEEESCPDCLDEKWRAAGESFRRLLREYPRGRFAADARGWLGYLHLRVSETAEGLAEYYRLLADETDAGGRAEGIRSLKLARGVAQESDMERLEDALASEPRVALAYAYHEIYNYALPDGTYIEVPEEKNPYHYYKEKEGSDFYNSEYYDKYYEWEEQERERLRRASEEKALARVAAFATRMLRRYPGAQVGGGFALRLAGVNLELGEAKAALELARRALSLGVAGEERASAMWIKGAAEQQLRDFTSARRTLGALVNEFPSGDLTEGARRLIAIAAEDAGDLDAALEQYLALDYTTDVAYFVDVLMTTDELASFISHRPDIPQRDMLVYSLGVRYLRLGRFEEARAAYAQVNPDTRGSGHQWYDDGGCGDEWPKSLRPCSNPKRPEDDEKPNVVRTRWVLRDLKTLEEIELLQGVAECATDDESKAEALYQLASYFYQSSELTFYNPAAWRGIRGGSFLYSQVLRTPNEPQLMRRYMEEHEPLARALKLYLEAVRLYPRTRAARDALYTAALIHQRLSDFEWYWPEQYKQGMHPGERLVTYADVMREYPGYQLPRGTFGWEPRTRTVNGGPGWAAAPKHAPLTREQRMLRRAKRAEARLVKGWELFGKLAGGSLRRWSLILLSTAGLLLVWRATRRSRALLVGQLARFARRHPRVPEGMPRPASSFSAQESYKLSWRALSATRGAGRVLWQVVLDRRARAALALNFLTHGVLTALLWALTWALRSG
jgi:TolA-binding protein